MIDVGKIREDFPILKEKVYDKPLIYFDNAATTQKPRCVVEKIEEGYYQRNANIHRGVHFLSQEATEAHEAARETVRKFINAEKSDEIIFTRGTTEGINLVASTFGDMLNDGDEIIVTQMEHHSNIVPWQLLQRRKKIELKVIPFDTDGNLQWEQLDKLITDKTKLVSVTQVSNAMGTINPVKEIIKKVHSHNIPVLIDGAQSVPHIKIDVQDLDADFLAFSGHKIYGPTGIGVLYGKEKWLEKMPPYQGGGEMIDKVSFSGTTFAELPFKFEAGTPDFIGSTALATALDYISDIGMENLAAYEQELIGYALKRLQEFETLRLIGNSQHRGGVVSFLIGTIHPYDLGSVLDKLGVAVRTGHHCAQPVMDAFGIDGTVRASFAVYNTKEEIDTFIDSIARAKKLFHQ